jgi:hypothetical protein
MPSETSLPLVIRVLALRPTGSVKMPLSEGPPVGAVGIEQPVKTTAMVNVLASASFMVFLQ